MKLDTIRALPYKIFHETFITLQLWNTVTFIVSYYVVHNLSIVLFEELYYLTSYFWHFDVYVIGII